MSSQNSERLYFLTFNSKTILDFKKGFPCGSAGKESACNAEELGLIPGLGRCPGEEKGYPLQCSGLENSMDCMCREFHIPYTQFPQILSFYIIIIKLLKLEH